MKKLIPKNISSAKGFTLIEIIVVLSVISILSAVTLPGFITGIKKNRFREMKALLNQYAAECLEKYRLMENISNELPDSFQGDKKIKYTGYKFNDNANCTELFAEPISNDDTLFFNFGFYIGPHTGNLLTYGEPSPSNQDALDLCYSWAGNNCNNPSKINDFNSSENNEEAKKICIENFLTNRSNGIDGEFVTWDDDSDTCSKDIFIVDGYIYESEEDFDAMNTNLSCLNWLNNKKEIEFTGSEEFSDCGPNTIYFFEGDEVGSKVDMDYEILQKELKECETTIESKRKNNYSGAFFFQGGNAPKDCGKVWICEKVIYKTEDEFNDSSCSSS